MDKATRNALRLTTIACRKTLEADFARQLEGTFGIGGDGAITDAGRLPHLDYAQREQHRRIAEALRHRAVAGATPAAALVRFVREAAFSTLNRLAALKLMEAPERELVPPSVGAGAESRGFTQFKLISPEAVRAEPDGGYRLYLELLFDDLAEEIGVLFDRDAPPAILFPAPAALADVLTRLNDPAVAAIWAEDETIGWIYQYFTPKEQRDAARKASAAPRDGYELAFLNQFFTPRYVVAFLTDNTLGRTWYEMRRGETRLVDDCRYLVRRKHPIWLEPGQEPPPPFPPDADIGWQPADPVDANGLWARPNPDLAAWWPLATYALTVDGYGVLPGRNDVETLGEFFNDRAEDYRQTGQWHGTFEELRACLFFAQRLVRHSQTEVAEGQQLADYLALNRAICDRWNLEVEAILHRPKQDPRALRVLDPACGSGHFLLYAFDLLLTIYDEAYDDDDLAPALRRDYPDRDRYRRAVPELILRHNLHGIDIDLRAVQIAQLALWLRAQRAYALLGLRAADRPPIARVNVVGAEPLPGERDLLDGFLGELDQPALADLVSKVWEELAGLGEIGSLLKADGLIHRLVAEAKRDWQSGRVYDQVTLFTSAAPPRQERLDLAFITDEAFWRDAEQDVLAALRRYAASASTAGDRYRRRLFRDDAAQGFAFLELFLEPFDVVLMNPPFGAASLGARPYVERAYPKTKHDLYAAFVERGLEVLSPCGYLGAITSRTGFFLTSYQKWRKEIILDCSRIHVVADLGQGVLDTAMVETAAYVLERRA